MTAVLDIAVSAASTVSIVGRLGSDPAEERDLRVSHALCSATGSPGANVMGYTAEVIRLRVLVKSPQGQGEGDLGTAIDAVTASLDGATLSATGYFVTPLVLAGSTTEGNVNDMRVHSLVYTCVAIQSGAGDIVTAHDGSVALTEQGSSSPITHDVVSLRCRRGEQPFMSSRSGVDGVGSYVDGQPIGSGTLLLSGNTFPPTTGTYEMVHTLRTGVSETYKIRIHERAVVADPRDPNGLIVWAVSWSETFDGGLA